MHEGRGLPPGVPLLAALGLAVLCLCTLPAMHAQRALERDHSRVLQETREAEQHVERLQRELRSGPAQHYLQIQATRTLLHEGANYIRERDARLARRRRDARLARRRREEPARREER